MSILASLARAYERLPDAPPFGYSAEKIGFIVSLNLDGSVAHVIDVREGDGKKKLPKMMMVPESFKRPGTTPRPFFLWDNANYALGAEAIQDAEDTRFECFKTKHLALLARETDDGLSAFHRFLLTWEPAHIGMYLPVDELRNQKVAFALESERKETLLHQRPRAREIWGEQRAIWCAIGEKKAEDAVCLVAGIRSSIARTHPAIKGIPSSSGKDADSIVSYNESAFTSYGHEQGDNAPVSEAAAFAYTTALNRFLERDSGHRIQIGDTSTVFWADASAQLAAEAETFVKEWLNPSPADDEKAAVTEIADKLAKIRAGVPLREIEPDLAGVRFHVLGLAPNAARLSIRFYFEDSFGVLTENYQRYLRDVAIGPPPKDAFPPLWRYLVELAVLGKRENIPPNLAGEWMRSILSGTRYPLTLLSAVLGRIRADGEVNALRVGILRALLVRNFNRGPGTGGKNREAPVAFDPENRSKGYMLGRLFAVYEQAQSAALGRNINTTIKDKFYASASATPRNVFALLDRGSVNHLSKVGKERPGQRVNLEKAISGIMEMMSPGGDPFPASLSAEEQALFGLGYYHQRGEFFRKRDSLETEESSQ